MGPDVLIVRRDGPVARVTLNRPDVRNALDDQLIAALGRWAEQAAADVELRAVVLSGAGRTFCAGADIGWMSRAISYTHDENIRDARALAAVFERLNTLPVPVIARVQGAALGGGSGLVAVSDIVVAADDAVFGFTEVKLGIVPAVISPFAIAKIGTSAARELFLTGTRFSAARALHIGLIHQIVPVDSLDAAVDAYLQEILSAGPQAVSAAKALIAEVAGRPAAEVAPRTVATIARHRTSAEGQEGLRAFLERRTPRWGPR